MRTWLIGIAAVASCTSTDSTDISGTYDGNATYTISPGSGGDCVVGAFAASVDIEGDTGGVLVTLAPSCVLTGALIELLTFPDNTNKTRFAFTSDSIDASQSCTLVLAGGSGLAISVVAGDLTVDHGLTLALDVGGGVAGSGYAVYQFEGVQ